MSALKPMVYVAHPFGGRPANLGRARRWLQWWLVETPDVCYIAPWILEAELLDDADSGTREDALQRCLAIVSRCDAIVLCGGRVSPGMERELAAARAAGIEVIDCTDLGEEPPRAADDKLHEIAGERVKDVIACAAKICRNCGAETVVASA